MSSQCVPAKVRTKLQCSLSIFEERRLGLSVFGIPIHKVRELNDEIDNLNFGITNIRALRTVGIRILDD